MKSILLALFKPIAARLAEPIVIEAKHQIHRLLIAVALAATGVGCIIVGLTYLASSLWHALVPTIGTVGADLTLGTAYALIAVVALLGSSRMIR